MTKLSSKFSAQRLDSKIQNQDVIQSEITQLNINGCSIYSFKMFYLIAGFRMKLLDIRDYTNKSIIAYYLVFQSFVVFCNKNVKTEKFNHADVLLKTTAFFIYLSYLDFCLQKGELGKKIAYI